FLLSCDVLGIDYVGTFDRELVRSDVPTLVLSGEFDPVTPPVWGNLIASELPNSFAYTFPTGHGVIASECPQQLRWTSWATRILNQIRAVLAT
ncbi:hypothetical protein HC928_03415, partial [bacterium]|nr:hypothetical protein [bacterium]